MGISSALNNAASGLAATSRLADTISTNVANAMTPSFGRRSTELSSVTLGGYGSGVRVVGTTRAENAYLTAERRGIDASLGAAATRSTAYERIMTALGDSGADNALATLATGFETSLMSATASPQSATKLTDALNAAKALAAALNAIAAENASIRTDADAEIARQVATVNEKLNALDELNRKLASLVTQGVDVTALQDQRARLIDDISSIIPVKVVRRDRDQVAIYSQNGGVLLDGRVFELSFTPANLVTADMTIGAGLSPLMQDQGAASGPVTLAAGTGTGFMDGGSLGALFEVRDSIVPEFDGEIDRYAQEIIDRFRDLMPPAALDTAGDGLFVDGWPGPLTGLAGRIAVNAAADPAQGGAVWRLRDGLAAAAPGDEGFGGYLQGLADAMGASRGVAGLVSQSAANDAATIASEITSFFAARAIRSDEDQAFRTARQATLAEQEANETGVDTDAEMQALIIVEQAYAANARVLSVIDELMRLLLEV